MNQAWYLLRSFSSSNLFSASGSCSWFRGPELRNSFPRAEVFIQGIRCCLWHWGPQGFPAINFAVHLRLCGVYSNGWGDIPPTLVLRMPSVCSYELSRASLRERRGSGCCLAPISGLAGFICAFFFHWYPRFSSGRSCAPHLWHKVCPEGNPLEPVLRRSHRSCLRFSFAERFSRARVRLQELQLIHSFTPSRGCCNQTRGFCRVMPLREEVALCFRNFW